MNDLYRKYKDDGLVVLGICTSTGQEKMESVAEELGITYPIAKDPDQKGAKDWKVKWFPTYAAIDRNGKLRAIGMNPDGADKVIQKLLMEKAPAGATASADVPAEFLEGTAKQRERLSEIQGAAEPPALKVERWMNVDSSMSEVNSTGRAS